MLSAVCLTVCLAAVAVSGNVCKPPPIENGEVKVYLEEDDSFVGEYTCQPGFALVGASKAKCRDGVWNSKTPVCTALGKCDQKNLPRVKYARLIMNKEFRGAVWRYKCKNGYKRYGEGKVYCDVDSWSIFAPPICARPGCDMTSVTNVRYGKFKSVDDSIIRFKCDEGTSLVGPSTVWCNGRRWNDTLPSCHKEATAPSLAILTDLGEAAIEDGKAMLEAGAAITVLCKGTGGFPEPLISIHIDGVEVNVPQEFRNSYTFTPDKHHLGSEVRCSARNFIMTEDITEAVTLKVSYPPSSVHLTTSDSGVAGETAVVNCVSDKAFPEPEILFKFSQYVDIIDEMIEHHKMDDGSYISAIERTFILPKDSDMVEVQCITADLEIKETKQIHIQRPCMAPVMNIDEDSLLLKSGESFEITCHADGGNPDPDVIISMNDNIIGEGQIMAHAEIEAREDMTGAVITCQAANSIMEEPLTVTKHLEVQYGPEDVHLEAPEEVMAGEELVATCLPSPSNPPANIVWSVVQDGEMRELGLAESETLALPVDDPIKHIVVVCKAVHDLGVKEKRQEVTVLYPTTTPEAITTTELSETSTDSVNTESATIDGGIQAAIEYTYDHDSYYGETYSDNDEYDGEDEYEDDYTSDSTTKKPVFLESSGAINANVMEIEDDYVDNVEKEAVDEKTEQEADNMAVKLKISSLEDATDDTNVAYEIVSGKPAAAKTSMGSYERRADSFYDERMSSDEARDDDDDDDMTEDTLDYEKFGKKADKGDDEKEVKDEAGTDTIVKSKTGKILDLKALAQKNEDKKAPESKSNIESAKLTHSSSGDQMKQSILILVSIQMIRAYL